MTVTTIPVWRTSIASVAVIVLHPGAWFRLSWLVLGIYLLLHGLMACFVAGDVQTVFAALSAFTGEVQAQGGASALDPDQVMAFARSIQGSANRLTLVNMLSMIATLFCASQLLVVWCRFAALGDDAGGRWFVFRFGARELEMLGALVILGLGLLLAAGLAFVVSTVAVMVLGIAGYAVMSVLFTALFVLAPRLCMLVPQVACDGGLDLAGTWRRTAGHTWRIFAVSLNLGFIGFVVALLCLAGNIALMYATGTWENLMTGDQSMAALLVSPWFLALLALDMVLVVAAHVVIVAMLGLIHARITPPETVDR